MRIRILIQGKKPIWIHADLDPGQPLPSLKVNFYVNNMLNVCKKSLTITTYWYKYKNLLERLKIRFICKFCSVSLLLDPDPHSQYGSGSRNAVITGIRNTAGQWRLVENSVADPDLPDTHVFGPPGSGSGSISQRYGSGSGSFYLFFCIFFDDGLECVGHSFAYVAHLWFLRDVWIRTQSAAVASWRATDLATHPSNLATHPSITQQKK